MEAISIFDIFKIGVGPSSSHTLGPWKAASLFLTKIKDISPDRIVVHLYGSLSKTGRGHATDLAVQLGLEGYDSITIPTTDMPIHIERIKSEKTISINGTYINFSPDIDIVFESVVHDLHPNTLTFKAYRDGEVSVTTTYASVGGGFVESEHTEEDERRLIALSFPIHSGKDILNHTDSCDCSIAEIVHQNELCFHGEKYIIDNIDTILDTMLESVYQGCMTDGLLPGGLDVKRRAKSLCYHLTGEATYNTREEWITAIMNTPQDFSKINSWIGCFALAVNEVNAALGRVVTSPTNGAAGVIPAVLLYYYFFCKYEGKDSARNFLFTAGEIGCLFKKGATISAAVGGCQAEIGVSSAMAAAGLAEVLGGSTRQVLMAAEIAMEHHLGLTCDPIGGLVQVPCIERNVMGAVKAITAANLALNSDPESAKVHIDAVINTMWETAQDMNTKYKETSEGGLAISLPVIMPSC